jgi:PEP-CTERM motif
MGSPARAGILWYNGDYDNRDALANQTNVPINTGTGFVINTSLVYENFVVPTGQVWTIDHLFSNNQLAFFQAPTTATWSIREGVSAGNGGTVVASGDSTAALTPLTQNGTFFYAGPETNVSVAITPIVLTAGTYWVAVAPDSQGFFGDQSYVETTSGQNSVGVPAGNDGNSFITNTLPSNFPGALNFAPTSSIEGAGNWDYSLGVSGTFTGVPEPASIVLLGAGAAVLACGTRRRLRKGQLG